MLALLQDAPRETDGHQLRRCHNTSLGEIMNDPTEAIRKVEAATINANPGRRKYLEAKYGEVWDTSELQRDFTVLGFAAPFCIVERDGVKGSVCFQHAPRLYYSFEAE